MTLTNPSGTRFKSFGRTDSAASPTTLATSSKPRKRRGGSDGPALAFDHPTHMVTRLVPERPEGGLRARPRTGHDPLAASSPQEASLVEAEAALPALMASRALGAADVSRAQPVALLGAGTGCVGFCGVRKVARPVRMPSPALLGGHAPREDLALPLPYDALAYSSSATIMMASARFLTSSLGTNSAASRTPAATALRARVALHLCSSHPPCAGSALPPEGSTIESGEPPA